MVTSMYKIPCLKLYTYSQYSIQDNPFVLNVVYFLWAMLFVAHVNFELRDLNYDNFCIENVHCILTKFNGDVLFELPLVVNPDNHFW
jgi:hypothetical protein